MPTNTASGYRGDAGLESRLVKMEDAIRQLRERATRPQKIPAAVVPASAGIIGMAEIVSSGGVVFPAGASEMTYGGVAYNAPTDVNAGSAGASTVPLSDWLTVDGYRLYVSEGWYVPVQFIRVEWADINDAPPAFGGPYMYGGYDAVHNDYGVHARVPFGGSSSTRGGFQQIGNYGPTYIHEGSDFHAELRPVGPPPLADNDDAPFASRIIWNITKLA